MKDMTMGRFLQAASATALFATGIAAQALPLGDPTLVVSTALNPNQSTLAAPADPRNSVSYFQAYWDVDAEQRVEVLNVPPTYGDSAAAWSVNTGNAARFTRASNTAAPLALDATSVNEARSDGGNAYANTGATVRTWYVLSGGSGFVNLRVDAAFQGQLIASGADSGTNFTHQVGVLTGPGDLSLERVLVTNGAKGQGVDCNSFGQPGTIANRCGTTDGTLVVNDIIRSNPFTVEFGVPFRLSLAVGTNAATSNGYALADFSDPRLATSSDFLGVAGLTPEGVILDLDGDWTTTNDLVPLSQRGYGFSVLPSAVPEPGTLALLALGLAGLAQARRRKS